MSSLRVNNIKLHFRFRRDRCSLSRILNDERSRRVWMRCEKKLNFWILRDVGCKFVYVIFDRQNVVNVSGVRDYSQIAHALRHLCELLNVSACCIEPTSLRIDNVTCTGNLGRAVDLSSLHAHMIETKKNNEEKTRNDYDDERIRITSQFNPYYFPGLTLRFYKHRPSSRGRQDEEYKCLALRKFGSVVLFHSGRFNVLGVITRSDIVTVTRRLCVLMRESQRMNIPEMSFVWIADS